MTMISFVVEWVGVGFDSLLAWSSRSIYGCLATVALVAGLYLARRDPAMRHGLLAFAFPTSIYRHPSTWVDIKFYTVNALLFTTVFAWFAGTSQLVFAGMTALLGHAVATPPLAGHSIPATLATTLMHVLAVDFGYWLAHYCCHRVPLLWEFHKVHHSAEVLTPFSARRVHPTDDLIEQLVGGALGGTAVALCATAFGEEALLISIFQLNVIFFLFALTGVHLRHSHVWLPYTGWLGHIFISPAHHQLHHSSAERHWDKNMGYVLAIWDWMFGALYVPQAQREEFPLGIGPETKDYNSVWRLYALPFIKAGRLLRRGHAEEARAGAETD